MSARSFWKYLQATSVIELDAVDPFAGMIKLTTTKVLRNSKERKAFTAQEVASLYGKVLEIGDGLLADLIALGVYTAGPYRGTLQLEEGARWQGLSEDR